VFRREPASQAIPYCSEERSIRSSVSSRDFRKSLRCDELSASYLRRGGGFQDLHPEQRMPFSCVASRTTDDPLLPLSE
jgi:hypothetical protein